MYNIVTAMQPHCTPMKTCYKGVMCVVDFLKKFRKRFRNHKSFQALNLIQILLRLMHANTEN